MKLVLVKAFSDKATGSRYLATESPLLLVNCKHDVKLSTGQTLQELWITIRAAHFKGPGVNRMDLVPWMFEDADYALLVNCGGLP